MSRDPKVTSKIMASVRARDTKPEIAVRRRLWAMGYRYRVDYRRIPGRPDIVFPSQRVAVFIDGDFWHGNAWKIRGHKSMEEMFPSRTDWWIEKIHKNMERDKKVSEMLSAQGWVVLRFWESTVERNLDEVVGTIAKLVDSAKVPR